MNQIKIITILFGGVILLARLPGVLWPARVKELHKQILEIRNTPAKIISVLLLIISFMILVTILKNFRAVEILAILFGISCFVLGVVFLFLEEIRPIPKKILEMNTMVYRVLSGVGTAIGLAILVIGLMA